MKTREFSGTVTLAASRYGKERDYWLNKFAGEPVKTSFPYDHNHTGCKWDICGINPDRTLFDRLMKVSKGSDYTLHMILTAGLVALLGKYSPEPDIILGMPIYNQEREEEFLNTALALRNQLEDSMSFKELLVRVRQNIIEANQHQNYPLETLLYQLNLKQARDDSSLFDVALLLENIQQKKYIEHTRPNVIFSFFKSHNRIEGKIEYNALLYEKETMKRISGHFVRLLEEAIFDVEKPVREIRLLTKKEKEQLLWEFNRTGPGYPRKTIDELFRQQAEKTPGHLAVTDQRESLTYGALDEWSHRLAAYLQHKGLKQEEAVGIMAENNVNMIMGILGILEAGGAYLPLNSEYPEERQKYLLEDGNVGKLLIAAGQEHIDDREGKWDDIAGLEILHLSLNLHLRLESEDTWSIPGPLTRCHSSVNLAYIIYTSGSTGTPKGAVVEHRSVVRLVKNTNYVEFKKDDRILQTGALDFDASTFEIWGALLNGLQLHLAGKEAILIPKTLKKIVREKQITTMWMTAALFNHMVDEDIEIFAGPAALLVGGDVLSPLHINRVRKAYPDIKLINGYGPTENTTFSLTHLIRREYKQGIPIGKPISHSTAYILDKHYQLVPIGVQGELCVGGDGLSRGYLNNPELTDDKFLFIKGVLQTDLDAYHQVKSPARTTEKARRFHSQGARTRIYRTGDLARWLPEGNIDFLGRIDHQVKIRGYRIEPGEIENHLTKLENIDEAVVVDKESGTEKFLCAYLVSKEGKKLDLLEVKQALSGNLPDYMIPSYFAQIEKIPLTANGKADRNVLPKPELQAGLNYVAPRDDIEECLVETWSRVLAVEKSIIGIDSDFFDLGGHSLKATLLIARVHKNLNVKIPLAELFRAPTIREMAEYVKHAGGDSFLAINAVEEKEYYPLSSAQKRMFVLQQMMLDRTVYNVPQVVSLTGLLVKEKLENVCWKLIKRHESFRTSFELIDETPVQKIHREVAFEIEYNDLHRSPVENEMDNGTGKLSPLPGESTANAIKDFVRPFDLSRAPLLRLRLIKENNETHILMVDIHHIVTDGTSIGILIKEFMKLYSGEELPKMRIGCKDFSPWQNKLFQARDKKRQEAYWKKKLEGDIPLLDLPTDFPRPAEKTFTGNSVDFKISREQTRALKLLISNEGVTMFIALAALFNIFLYKISSQEDLLIGIPTAGRRHTDLAHIIGMFVNTLVLRNNPAGEKTIKGFLNEVKENALEAFENQEYQFEELVEQLSLDRDISRNPLFDVTFSLHNEADPELLRKIEIPGLEMEPYKYRELTARFDLELIAVDLNENLSLTFIYAAKLFKKDTVDRFVNYFKQVVESVLEKPAARISTLEIISGEEKKQILFEINDTNVNYPREKTIHELFEQQAAKNPGQPAVTFNRDLSPIYEELESKKINPGLIDDMEKCCFKKNPYIFRFQNREILTALDFFTETEQDRLIMLRTHRLNYAAVNKPVLLLLDYFTGSINVKSLLQGMSKNRQEFLLYDIEKNEYSDFIPAAPNRITVNGNIEEMIRLVRVLYRSHLIDLADFHAETTKLTVLPDGDEHPDFLNEKKPGRNFKPNKTYDNGRESRSPVLLLGDRTGQGTTGLLYIASFLRRNGIQAYCQWNDMNKTTRSLKTNIRMLMEKIKPKILGVSMKWFPHIARVLEICKIARQYDSSVKIVVGGNTAAYYHQIIIRCEWVDYVVLGDGEIPFLKICRGEDDIPNCVYKKDGKIVERPITYVQDENNSKEIFLSHLDQIFVSEKDPYLAPYFYIYTGKGCSMSCLYCAGCKEVQERIFNRGKPFLRDVGQVRQDIIVASPYTSTFWFDFDLPLSGTLGYYKKLWEGIDLSDYFCEFYFWKLPSAAFMDLAVKTFKYVYFNIDLCSLSEPHRLKLSSGGLVKPQPTDKELLSFFDGCEKYANVEVIINQVTGLPYFSYEDIDISAKMLSHLHKTYSTAGEMDWARLHAQPGAPIGKTFEKYDMYCCATTYEEFLHYSRLNLQEPEYPHLELLNYPYIYSGDEKLNSKISQFYFDSDKQVKKYLETKRKQLNVCHHITYNQLDKKAQRLAMILKEKGVKADVIVGILTNRSIEMVIGMLAILKAGGAYLPIDPKYPQERVEYMLKDSSARVLIITSTLAKEVKKLSSPEVKKDLEIIFIDYVDMEFSVFSSSHLLNFSTSHSTNLAYVMYTSGSTGKPRGVMIEHKNVIRLVKNTGFIDFSREDRLLLTGSAAFDITTFEIWGPLLNGAELCLADESIILSVDRLGEVLKGNKISILHLIPQLFNQLAAQGTWFLSGIKRFFIGGDVVQPEYINLLLESFREMKIHHMYGPTENTTFSTFFEIAREYRGNIPIGQPINNSTVYVADKSNRLQPPGIPGELFTGGAGVARGYLNNVELTEEKFIENPFKPGERIFKTGDLARWLPGGNLEFLGRIDQQVKIRGIRIEPGEIENLLLNSDFIEEAVVVDKKDESGNKYLCAYLVSEKQVDTSQFRSILSKKLPAYMIPSYFVRIDKIPLNPNGKPDRKALPEPRLEPGKKLTAPGNEIERILVEIWAEVLKIEKDVIGINSNFFELGGHSLKAAAAISLIYRELNVRMPLGEIFKSPMIVKLAEYIKNSEEMISASNVNNEHLILIKPGTVGTNHMFFIHDATGEVDAYLEFCKHLPDTVNYWGIRAGKPDNYTPQNITIQELARTYLQAVKTIQVQGPYLLVGWSIGGTIAFEMARQLEQQSQTIRFLALIDTLPPDRNQVLKAIEFNIASELKLLRHHFQDPVLVQRLEETHEIHRLWSNFLDYSHQSQLDLQSFKDSIPRALALTIPNFARISIEELINYVNLGRMFDNARNKYIPAGKIITTVRFFKAGKNETMNPGKWNIFCREPITAYEVPGDHFSIFKMPDVKAFARLFVKIYKNL